MQEQPKGTVAVGKFSKIWSSHSLYVKNQETVPNFIPQLVEYYGRLNKPMKPKAQMQIIDWQLSSHWHSLHQSQEQLTIKAHMPQVLKS